VQQLSGAVDLAGAGREIGRSKAGGEGEEVGNGGGEVVLEDGGKKKKKNS